MLAAARPCRRSRGAPFYVHPADRPLWLACAAWPRSGWASTRASRPHVDGDLTPGETFQFGDRIARSAADPGPLAGRRQPGASRRRAASSPAMRCSPAPSAAPIYPAAIWTPCSTSIRRADTEPTRRLCRPLRAWAGQHHRPRAAHAIPSWTAGRPGAEADGPMLPPRLVLAEAIVEHARADTLRRRAG